MDWSDDKVLAMIEKVASANSGTDYKFSVGHHPVGYSCGGHGELKKVAEMIEKYGYNAHYSGHEHALCYGHHNNIGFYMSGAGGYAGTACTENDWNA